jgi:orotidine-5'-phosphate decarboxylase
MPGIGAQGGSPTELGAAFSGGPGSALVSASRSVIYAYRTAGGDWRAAAAAEAERLAREAWSVSGL